jgi:hypothetical protein
MKKFLTYAAGLIALEIIVFHATNAGQLLSKGGSAASGFVNSLEGR